MTKKIILCIGLLFMVTIASAVSMEFKTINADHIGDLKTNSFPGSTEYHISFSGSELSDLFDRLPEVKNLEGKENGPLNDLRILEIFKGNNESAKRIFLECRKKEGSTECRFSFAKGTPAG